MKTPKLNPQDPLPIYAQLERAIRGMILTGELKAGDQLPTVRQLAVDLKINANTVAKVYAELERSGAVETRRGVGSFVTELKAVKRNKPEEIERIITPALADLQRHGHSITDLIKYLQSLSK